MSDNRRPPIQGPGGGGPGRHPVSVAQPKNIGAALLRTLSFMKPYTAGLIAVAAASVLSAVLTALGPSILGQVTNEIERGAKAIHSGTGGIDFDYAARLLLLTAGIYAGAALITYAQHWLMSVITQKTMYRLRKSVDEKIKLLPLRYYDSNTFGDILSRTTNDIDTIANSLNQSITQTFSSLLTIIFTFVMMVRSSPVLTAVGLSTVPLSIFASAYIVKKSRKYYRGQQEYIGRINGFVEEMYAGHAVIKAFGTQGEVTAGFDELNGKLFESNRKAQFVSGIMMPLMMFLNNIGYVLVCIFGGLRIVSGQLLIGDVQAFIQYLRQFSMPVSQIANMSHIIMSTAAASERVFEFLDEPVEAPDNDKASLPESIAGNIEFRDVKFGYSPDKPLMQGLSISVRGGQSVALVGPTGAGKTTLANLLMRFYDIDGGEILIDGVSIMDIPRSELRRNLGMVLQDTWLFGGSIMDNIRYGRRGASDDEVIRAAKAAQCHDFIMSLPGGYNMLLGEDGSNISQGQRQLLTIARALLADPSVLILDEATSSVDTRTEMSIQRAMKNLTKNRTSFIIAHRLSTIRDADMIFAINDGAIVETGTHEQLIKKRGFYWSIYNSQFNQPA